MSRAAGPGKRASFPQFVTASLLVLLAGCGSEPEQPATSVPPDARPPASTSAAPTAATETRTVPASGLPIGDYLPPLDDGRIEVPIPAGWSPLPRDSNYLVRFYKDDRNGLPRIEVLAADNPYPGFEEVTGQNVAAFAQAVATELTSEGTKLAEPVLPMQIGNTFCARYVLRVTLRMTQGNVVAERQTIVVPKQTRVYTIHLLVLPNRLLPDRDAAYAVCAGLK